MTFLVSTVTTKKAYSTINIIKTRLYNKIEDDFLVNYLIIYIEKKIAKNFIINYIIDEFCSIKQHRA